MDPEKAERPFGGVGQERGWSSGWTDIAHLKGDSTDEMDEVGLSGEAQRETEDAKNNTEITLSSMASKVNSFELHSTTKMTFIGSSTRYDSATVDIMT